MKTLYSDILYNSKILYNVDCICTNVPIKLKFEFITTEIQLNVKLFKDKQCRCKEGGLYFKQNTSLSSSINVFLIYDNL